MPPPAPPQPNAGKVTPNLAMETEATRMLMLNRTLLQRLDPAVEDILITAAYVTLYDFNIELNQWSRKGVEGSLFVVKRNTQPRFQFIVLNRRNPDNLVEDLLSDFQYELHPPYLFYRNDAQEVNGIWFYNQQDFEAVASLFERILSAYDKVPPQPKAPSTKSEFEELEAVPTSAAIDGPLEPPPATIVVVSHAPDESLIDYFNGAANIGGVPGAPMAGRVHPTTESIPSAAPTHQTAPSVGSSAPPLPLHDANAHASRSTNIVYHHPHRRQHPTMESIPSSHVPLIIPSAAPTHQTAPSVGSSSPPLSLHDANAHASRSTNLVYHHPHRRQHPTTESIPSSHLPLIIPSAAPIHQTAPLVGSSAPPLPLHVPLIIPGLFVGCCSLPRLRLGA